MIVWSYSLFGINEDVYYKPMLENIRIAKANNARLIIATTDEYVNNINIYFSSVISDFILCVYPSEKYRGFEMILRYLAIDQQNADFYFIKDADSIVTQRELSIMNHWMLLSDKNYMIIRDNPIHVSPIMAGMFGFGSASRDWVVENCNKYFFEANLQFGYGIDQQWLADEIYPRIINDAQVYSSYFYFSKESLIRLSRSTTSTDFVGAPSEGNINPNSLEHYFQAFYGDQLMSIPYFSSLPLFLSHLIYGRVRPSLYLAAFLKWLKY